MTWVAVAVGGAAVVGAVASNSAANKQASGVQKGLNQSASLANQSRIAAMDLYTKGRQSAQAGIGSALDFYKKAAPARYAPMQLGNTAAQGVIGQGAAQANNAILGNPVDMSFAQPQKIVPDLSYLGAAQLPALPANDSIMGQQASNDQAINQQAGQPSKTNSILTANGYLASPTDMLNPLTQATNPLGLGSKITDKIPGQSIVNKITSKDPVTKALRKLF